jgi:hypothetical protein
MYVIKQEASDEALLNRLVYVSDKQTPRHGLDPHLKGVFTLYELLCNIGTYSFMTWFVDGKDEWFWVDDYGTQRTLILELIDCKSQKPICAEAVMRAANRYFELNLWRYRDGLKPRSGSKKETKWVRRYRRPKRMAILAQAAGERDRDEFEPGIRQGYLQSLKYAYEVVRLSSKDRSWKRFRDQQYKTKKGQ